MDGGERMVIVVCVCQNNGLMFNHRRQSRDRAVLEDLADVCGAGRLYMNFYSYKMFQEYTNIPALVCEDFLAQAKEGDFCFIEQDISPYIEKVQEVILYQWNRKYPADVYFAIDLKNGEWQLEKSEDLKGFSHDKITKEVYKKIL